MAERQGQGRRGAGAGHKLDRGTDMIHEYDKDTIEEGILII